MRFPEENEEDGLKEDTGGKCEYQAFDSSLFVPVKAY
jgi:hypothetical protein